MSFILYILCVFIINGIIYGITNEVSIGVFVVVCLICSIIATFIEFVDFDDIF